MSQTPYPRPEAVVFDIGNVLLEWHPHEAYDRLVGEARRREVFANVDLIGVNASVDLGAPFRETVYAAAEASPAYGDEIRLWHDHWLDLAGPPIDHSVRLLSALRNAGVPVFALSNFGRETLEIAEKKWPFLTNFDHRFVSAHLQMAKPDPAIYEVLETETGLAPDRLLFADDMPENIAAAEARGWQGHLFTDPAGWAARLVAAGLLTPDQAR